MAIEGCLLSSLSLVLLWSRISVYACAVSRDRTSVTLISPFHVKVTAGEEIICQHIGFRANQTATVVVTRSIYGTSLTG